MDGNKGVGPFYMELLRIGTSHFSHEGVSLGVSKETQNPLEQQTNRKTTLDGPFDGLDQVGHGVAIRTDVGVTMLEEDFIQDLGIVLDSSSRTASKSTSSMLTSQCDRLVEMSGRRFKGKNAGYISKASRLSLPPKRLGVLLT